MAVSKAQQASVNKYVKSNYDRINVTMPKGKRDEIKRYAESCGESVNGFINRAIDESMGGKATQSAAEAFEYEAAILTPEALQAAQEAAQNAGETVSAFIERAVDTQAQRDRLLQGMKTRNKEG